MKTEIESEQTKIQLEIPESYELSENEDGDRTYACFERPGSSDMVFSFLLEADEEDFQDAEDYIDGNLQMIALKINVKRRSASRHICRAECTTIIL